MLSRQSPFPARAKKLSLLPLLFLLPSLALSAEAFPERLSRGAQISLLSVSYTDTPHALFSKSCLRLYDAETSFDQLVDFAHFDDFDNNLFLLKFFLKEKKAMIRSEPFFDYFIEQSQKTNVRLNEMFLQLSEAEVSYIYSFIKTLHDALPNYAYDFDILTNNSETHISQILRDAAHMRGNPNERYVFSGIRQHQLQWRHVDDAYVLLDNPNTRAFETHNLPQAFPAAPLRLILALIGCTGIVFVLTCYQVIVCFFERIYLISIYKTAQILDFLLFFVAGQLGTIILLQDIFSNQSLFTNNLSFFFLFPPHVLAAFTLFNPAKRRKVHITYWSVALFASFGYFFVSALYTHEIPIVRLLIALPLFLRSAYFDFLAVRRNQIGNASSYIVSDKKG